MIDPEPAGPLAAPSIPAPAETSAAVAAEPATGEHLGREELAGLLAGLPLEPPLVPEEELFDFLRRLRLALVAQRDRLVEVTRRETGFVTRDCAEMVEGTFSFLEEFETFARAWSPPDRMIRHSYSARNHRDIRLVDRPLRCVAAIVPANAGLGLAVIVLASALRAGSRVILRPSRRTLATSRILEEAVAASVPPATVAFAGCPAEDFVERCVSSPAVDLLHYIGSGRYAASVLGQAFAAGKICLIDGEGNGMLYVDAGFSAEEAVRLIAAGATRYNGQTCTSVNGVLVHPSLYAPIRERLLETFRGLRVGPPDEPGTQIGPLWSESQARALQETLSQSSAGRLLCGGHVQGRYFAPAILEGVEIDDEVVRQGFSGPALWIRPVGEGEVARWLRRNRFPLSDGVLSHRMDVINGFVRDSAATRLCINGDPSLESMFEPWGARPPAGLNPVSVWTEKYRHGFQVEGTLGEILAVSPSPGRTAR